ncbi:FkbM family methyltransferase [Rhizobium sp. GN54]|uniref:FkbM family methyltransferase n=1 Tax=Rhizobium sp. GN54 TaxID=2898150 RepID=UPI001E508B59|nr:FkbM family methyltransferase [Rhizobium sp. GN54]MCD2183563.1 hypothetical protein [Rhizobium sp. GN54]
MPNTWTAEIARSGQQSSIDTILYIGAGDGNDIAELLDSRAKRIVLVEPNRDLIPKLLDLAGRDQRIDVLPLAVHEGVRSTHYTLYNLASHSSTRTATDLTSIFPGLDRVTTYDVEAASMEEILERLPKTTDMNDVLIVDAPGEEAAVINELLTKKLIGRFKHVALRAARRPMYEGGAAVDKIIDHLAAADYRIVWQDFGDPDFPQMMLAIEPLSLENQRLKAELQQQIELTTQLRKSIAEREAQIGELEGKQTDISLALRIQAIREADLKELQGRYASLLQEKEQQEALLRAVTHRLTHAAQFLDYVNWPDDQSGRNVFFVGADDDKVAADRNRGRSSAKSSKRP